LDFPKNIAQRSLVELGFAIECATVLTAANFTNSKTSNSPETTHFASIMSPGTP